MFILSQTNVWRRAYGAHTIKYSINAEIENCYRGIITLRKKEDLLKEIREALQEIIDTDMNDKEFMNFIIGEVFNRDVDSDQMPDLDGNLVKVYYGKCDLDSIALSFLAVSQSYDWSYDLLVEFFGEKNSDRINNLFVKKISKICEEFQIVPSNDLGEMLNTLVWYYFFGKKEIEVPLFIPSSLHKCKNYVELPKKKMELKETFDKESIVYITGLPGTGKKEFVKYYVSSENYNPYDVAWISVEKGKISNAFEDQTIFLVPDEIYLLEESKKELLNIGLLTVEKKLELLKQKEQQGLLVIDAPFLSDADIEFLNENIKPTKIKCIIITERHLFPGSVSEINLDDYSDAVLKQIFQNCYENDMPFSGEKFSKLCKNLNYNPLAVLLLAQTVKAIGKKEESINKLIHSFMDHRTTIWNGVTLPKIHNAYKSLNIKTGVGMKVILGRMFKEFPEEFYNQDLGKLAFWSRMGIPLEALLTTCSRDTIQNAWKYGFIKRYSVSESREVIGMSVLIADIILNDFPISFFDYECMLRKVIFDDFLGVDLSKEYDIWRDIVHKIIDYFFIKAAFLKTVLTEENRKNYPQWNLFVLDSIEVCLKQRDVCAAYELSCELYMSYGYGLETQTERFTVKYIQSIIKQTVLLITEMDGIDDTKFIQRINHIEEDCTKFINMVHHSKKYNYKEIFTMQKLGYQLMEIVKKCRQETEGRRLKRSDEYILRIHGHIKKAFVSNNRGKFNYMDSCICDCLNELKYDVGNELNKDYYQMHICFIKALYSSYNIKRQLLEKATEHFLKLVGNAEISNEMKLHTALHRFYYMLEQAYENTLSVNTLIPGDLCRSLMFEYGQLYRHYQNGYSIANLVLFYQVTIEYVLLIWNNSPQMESSIFTLYQIKNIVKDGEQLWKSLGENEEQSTKNKILQKVDTIVKERSFMKTVEFEPAVIYSCGYNNISKVEFPVIWIE